MVRLFVEWNIIYPLHEKNWTHSHYHAENDYWLQYPHIFVLQDRIFFLLLSGRTLGFKVVSNFCIILHKAQGDIGPLCICYIEDNYFATAMEFCWFWYNNFTTSTFSCNVGMMFLSQKINLTGILQLNWLKGWISYHSLQNTSEKSS